MPTKLSRAMPVATLLGEKYVDLALQCLGSMHAMCRDPLEFRLHDDGTLSAESERRLRDALPVHSVVHKEEANSVVNAALKPYPACLEFRNRFAYGAKLFDVLFLHPGETVAFTDCDIVFLKPFSGLFRFPDAGTSCLFMQDSQNSYSLRPWHMIGRRGISVPKRLNGGLFFYRKTSFSLPLLEDIISRGYPVYSRSFWLEQTCFGALAMSQRSAFWSAEQIVVPEDERDLTDRLVAAHLTSSVRGLLSDALSRQNPAADPVVIATAEMKRLRPLEFLVAEVKRGVKRRLA